MLAARPAVVAPAHPLPAAHPALADLAECFRGRFGAVGNRMSEFAGVAGAALEESRLHERISVDEVLDLVLLSTDLPQTVSGENEFGYPTVTVVREEHFRIELIFWRANAALAHHHGSPGAFQVLHGRRLNNEYRFHPRAGGGSLLDLGDLERVRSTLLRPGDVCPIPEGEGMIHDLAFLEPLCLTVSLRAREWEQDVSDNTLYLAPHVRYSPRSLLERRLTAMETLHQTRAWGSPDRVRAVLRSCPASAFALLLSILESGKTAAFAPLAAEVEEAHGDVGRLLVRSVEEQARRRRLVEGLRRVPTGSGPETEYAQRLVLGLAWAGLGAGAARAVVGRLDAHPTELLRTGAAALLQSFGEPILTLSPLIAEFTADECPAVPTAPVRDHRSAL